MSVVEARELPPDRQQANKRAIRLEYITIAYLLSAIFFIYLTLGSSQAMRTAWFEDILSLIPALAFLVATRFRDKRPSEEFPYGYHRVISIAFLCASVALFVMGFFLLYESITKLIAAEHPPIGVVQLFGHQIWLGWLMIPALVWSAIPAVILGRKKIPLARQLHDKVLFADAKMNKADWLTASAAIVGVLGIAFGLWWLDPLAAAVISLDILHDGFTNVREVVKDLMDSHPTSIDHEQVDPLPARVQTELKRLPWVQDARVRMREDGHVFFGEAFVVASDERGLVSKVNAAVDEMKKLDWRLQDLVIMPVSKFPQQTEDASETE
jgi:cation diffusion facilitator family transporter